MFQFDKTSKFLSFGFQTNRFVDVTFTSLDTTVNLQTWVILLDFLGLGAKIHDQDLLEDHARADSTNYHRFDAEAYKVTSSLFPSFLPSFTDTCSCDC